MGTWNNSPVGNDSAADWIGEVMERSDLRNEWRDGIRSEDHQVKRAAVWLFLQLGRVYVWPIETIQRDLELTLNALASLPDSMAVDRESVREQLELRRPDILDTHLPL